MKNYFTTIGLFVIAMSFGLVFTAFWFVGNKSYITYNTYLVYMNEAVSGLNRQSAVKFNGVEVGYVYEIALNQENLKQVKVTLKINDEVLITVDTVATLQTLGITGVTYIGLSAETTTTEPLLRKPDQIYPVIRTVPSMLVELDQAITEVSGNVKSVAERIEILLDDQNAHAIKETLQNVEKISATFSDSRDRFRQSIADANRILNKTALAAEQFPDISERLYEVLASVKKTSDQLNNTVQSVQRVIENSSTLINQLSQSVLPSTTIMLEKISRTSLSLDNFINQLSENPSSLIRGKSIEPAGPGET